MKNPAAAFLLALCCLLFWAGSPGAEEAPNREQEIQSRIFDVSALVGPHTLRIPVLGWNVPDDERYTYIADELPDMDDLIQYIYNETGPGNWVEDRFLAPAGDGKLAARNTPEVLYRVEAALVALMPRRERYAVTIALFELKEDAKELADDEFTEISTAAMEAAGASTAFFSTVTLRPDRSALVADLQSVRYVSDYTARVATLAAAYETITDVLYCGTEFVLKLKETPTGAKVALQMERWTLEGMDEFETPGGAVQQPRVSTCIIEESFEVKGDAPPPVSFKWSSGDKLFLLLVQVR
ncbi:MAG: hypothetical protein DRP90_01980 [Planctomycetota bacterium]|nr:MAG: hypothetical protein DRP90_01980 [Planctomycetota bacterium]